MMHKDLARKVEEVQRQQKEQGKQLASVYSIVKILVEPSAEEETYWVSVDG